MQGSRDGFGMKAEMLQMPSSTARAGAFGCYFLSCMALGGRVTKVVKERRMYCSSIYRLFNPIRAVFFQLSRYDSLDRFWVFQETYDTTHLYSLRRSLL